MIQIRPLFALTSFCILALLFAQKRKWGIVVDFAKAPELEYLVAAGRWNSELNVHIYNSLKFLGSNIPVEENIKT